mgnify:CR=1 FL=1
MPKRRYLIKNEVGHFWTGYGWSAEYPDAALYDHKRDAQRDSFIALFKAVRVSVEVAD